MTDLADIQTPELIRRALDLAEGRVVKQCRTAHHRLLVFNLAKWFDVDDMRAELVKRQLRTYVPPKHRECACEYFGAKDPEPAPDRSQPIPLEVSSLKAFRIAPLDGITFTMEFNNVQPDLVHVLAGCAREWPHKGVMCCVPNIVLGEE